MMFTPSNLRETSVFQTENSVYEIDPEDKRIRRVSGKNPPTFRFAPEGSWKDYKGIYHGPYGHLLIEWDEGHSTITTPGAFLDE